MATNPRQTEEFQVRDWAKQNRLTYYDTRQWKLDDKVVTGAPLDKLKPLGLAPIKLAGQALTVGIAPSTKQTDIDRLPQLLPNFQLTYTLISDSGLGDLNSQLQKRARELVAPAPEPANLSQQLEGAHPKFIFKVMAQLAQSLGASDIHVEPTRTNARVRFRIDGVLHPVATISKDRYGLLLNSLQLSSGAKWGVDAPQSGRLTEQLKTADGREVPVSMRLETVPGLNGHDIVVRIFSLDVKFLKLPNMGLTDAQRAVIEDRISHPHGMVLSVGPTGSGKTSMLYAVINELISPSTKIVTLEDPVEYETAGITQIPVKTEEKDSFMAKLRAVLREDPNIIMIGEIRDLDTARSALQAALTGHLVLSTFHAASAAAALSRLMDMIGDNPLLASALRVVQAQRLVRRVCPDCKEQYAADPKLAALIAEALDETKKDKLMLTRGKGCNKCNGLGYRGRVAIIEQLVMSPEIVTMVSKGNVESTSQAIQAQAIKQGMIPLLKMGLQKAMAGETTVDEIFRAIES